MAEEMVVRPLSGEEVQEALIHKIRQSLQKTCNLRPDDAYTSFQAEISIRIKLSDYGREVPDNHQVTVTEFSGLPDDPEAVREFEEMIQMDAAPPNQVRIESEQKVPIEVTEDGKKTTKFIRYAPKKTFHSPQPPKANPVDEDAGARSLSPRPAAEASQSPDSAPRPGRPPGVDPRPDRRNVRTVPETPE